MKIQCDVCNKKEACVFCSADEAALCDVCDQGVHHANKLASKHERFSLLQPSSTHFPLCDICQEKRANVFCQQDRAILCNDCDLPLHTANEFTQKHNRFLLSGIKLSHMMMSNTSKKDDVVVSNNNNECDLVPDLTTTNNEPTLDYSEKIPNLGTTTTTHVSNNNTISSTNNQLISGGSTSKISDYLIDMLPGWRFEDLIADRASLSPLGFYKQSGNNHDYGVKEDALSYYDMENNERELTSCSTQFENFWVPQAAGPMIAAAENINDNNNVEYGQNNQQSSETYYSYTSGLFHGTKHQQQQEETCVNAMNFSRKCLEVDDNIFTVPEITSSIVGSKRTRSFW